MISLNMTEPEHRALESVSVGVGTAPVTVVSLGQHLTSTAWQVFLPFLLAGIGSTMAGVLLDIVKVCTTLKKSSGPGDKKIS